MGGQSRPKRQDQLAPGAVRSVVGTSFAGMLHSGKQEPSVSQRHAPEDAYHCP